MSITARETKTYDEALALPHYADFSPGEHYADLFASLVTPGATVLDAGCGSGKGVQALRDRGYYVHGCDLTGAGLIEKLAGDERIWSGVCLWRSLAAQLPFLEGGRRYDYVYCTDVLEHIPTTFTMLVVHRLLEAASRGVFLSISLVPDHFGTWLGRPLHLSVRRYDEWLEDLRELAIVRDARDLGTNATFLLEPRR